MSKVLIIGAGGVGTVVAHKVAQHPEVFSEIMIASRTQSKCDAIVKAIGNPNIKTAKVDADNVDELVSLFNSFKPEIVINVALPYQDLTTTWIQQTTSLKTRHTLNTAGSGHTKNALKMPD